MANFGAVAKGVGRGSSGFFGKLLRIKWSYLFIIFIFIQAVSVGINNGGGVLDIANSLGERFFNLTDGLQSTALKVIDNGAVFNGIWDFIVTFFDFFSNIWLIYLWIKLFDYLFGKSPFSNESAGFINLSFGIFLFFLLQIAYLLLVMPNGRSNLELIRIPFYAFYDLFRAIVLIFSSIDFDFSTGNFAPCNNSLGCVI